MTSLRNLCIIECRDENGSLDFTDPQPESVFGSGAITGMSSDKMASLISRRVPDAVMTGDSVSRWPSLIDPRWVARKKTW